MEADKPTTGVPDEVASALSDALRQSGWVKCADAVMAADPSVWPKWKRFRGKHRRGRSFILNDRVSLVALSQGESSLEQLEDSISLNIPDSR